MEEKAVDLSLETLIRECSLNPVLGREHFYYFSLRNRENIHEIFKYKKFNDDFTDKLSVYRRDDYIIGMIRPSYEEFLKKIITLLNAKVQPRQKDDEKLTEILLKRVQVLSEIKSEQELKEEFPYLYRDLQDGRAYYNNLQKIRGQEGYTEEQYASGEHYYYSCALKKSLQNFIKSQTELYKRFTINRHSLKELQEKKTYNSYIQKNFNMDKLYMYVIHEYLNKCEKTNNREEIKKYITIIEKYLNSERDKTIHIITDEGIKVDLDNINKRLYNLKRRISDNSSVVDWVLIPEGKEYHKVTKEGEAKRLVLTKEEIEHLKAKGERKRIFYESSPYIAKAIGLRKYRGYIAYIYENGNVILDREYNEDTPKSASGDAIYVLKAEDFEVLSKQEKPTLRKHPKVEHMNHTKTWEKRVLEKIEEDATREQTEQAHQLVKRLKEK